MTGIVNFWISKNFRQFSSSNKGWSKISQIFWSSLKCHMTCWCPYKKASYKKFLMFNDDLEESCKLLRKGKKEGRHNMWLVIEANGRWKFSSDPSISLDDFTEIFVPFSPSLLKDFFLINFDDWRNFLDFKENFYEFFI